VNQPEEPVDGSADATRALLQQALVEIDRLRAAVAKLEEENRRLRNAAAGAAKGGGGSSGGGQSEHERLRQKAEAQRDGKRRRAAARAAARPAVRKRGKRSVRPPFVADATMGIDIPREERTADAVPNGWVDRPFFGVRISRHNVLIRLHEYVSPTVGRSVAKLPEGWVGEYTPDTRVAINTLSIGGMTEPKIRELFADHGVRISAGHINNILLGTADALRNEHVAAHRAGMEHSPVVGVDGTYATCDGEPRVCHIVGNEVFTTLTTTHHKDRVSVIGVLAGAPVGHRVGEEALAHPGLGVAAREVLRRVSDGERPLERCDKELVDLATKLRTDGLDADGMNQFLKLAMPAASENTLRQMLEATAGQWLRKVLAYLPTVMLADGGTNYHGILAFLQLCWIHILRPYSLLPENVDSERVLREGWVLYRRLCDWRETRDRSEVAVIEAEFERVFDETRCDDVHVRHQVRLTHAHREELLTLLRHPYAPAENNGQERAAKARVRKRDISFGPRSERGLHAWDTTQSIVGTLRKLKISPAAFFSDRITRARRFERLDVLVTNECIRRYGPRTAPGTF
jgi:hypothetical protein